MRINNNSSPSFGALRMDAEFMQSVLPKLKEPLRKSFSSQADSFSRFAEKHKVDVFFQKAPTPPPAGFFGLNTERSIEYAKELIEKTAKDVVDRVSEVITPIAEGATEKLAADLTSGADEAARAAISGRVTETVNEIVTPSVRDIGAVADRVAEERVSRAQSFITDGAANPNYPVFTVFITGKGEDAQSKIIDSVDLPAKKGIFGIKKGSLKRMFKDLKSDIKEIEWLDSVKKKYGNIDIGSGS